MQGKIRWLLILTTLLISPSVLAILSIPCGWYLQADIGSTKLLDKTYPGSSSSSGVGGGGSVGYKFMPYFASEVYYYHYANTTIDNAAGTEVAWDKHYSYGLVAKGIVPFTDTGFEAYGKIGAQRIYSSLQITNTLGASSIGLGTSQHSTTGLFLGAGAQYFFWPELGVAIQWTRAKGNSNTGTLDLYSIGLAFIFD